MIEVEKLEKVYGLLHKTTALAAISFTVPKGAVFGFLGPNGAGKTTTIRILATVLEPTGGTVRVGGYDLLREPFEAKKLIGLMPEEVAFYPTMTGEEHLVYYASLLRIPRRAARTRARSLLEQFGLLDVADRKLKTYSHGMRRRLAVAQCLLNDPEVLLLDEPASGLDPQGIHDFRELIHRLRRESRTVFLSSHLLSEVEQLCDRVGIINQGRMVLVDSMENLLVRFAESAPTVLHVVAEGISSGTLQALDALPGVMKVVPTTLGADVIAQPGVDVAAEVSRAVIVSGALLRELRAEHRSLEQLFLSLTGKGAT